MVCKIGIHVFRTSKFDKEHVCGGPHEAGSWDVSTNDAHLRHLQGLSSYTQHGFTPQGTHGTACPHKARIY